MQVVDLLDLVVAVVKAVVHLYLVEVEVDYQFLSVMVEVVVLYYSLVLHSLMA